MASAWPMRGSTIAHSARRDPPDPGSHRLGSPSPTHDEWAPAVWPARSLPLARRLPMVSVERRGQGVRRGRTQIPGERMPRDEPESQAASIRPHDSSRPRRDGPGPGQTRPRTHASRSQALPQPRTIRVHLRSIYAKLGISSRSELQAADLDHLRPHPRARMTWVKPMHRTGRSESSARAIRCDSRARRFGRESVDSASGAASQRVTGRGARVRGTGSRPDLRFG